MEFAKRMGRVERKKMSAISLMRYEQLLFISAKMDSKITSSLPTNLQVNRAFAIYGTNNCTGASKVLTILQILIVILLKSLSIFF